MPGLKHVLLGRGELHFVVVILDRVDSDKEWANQGVQLFDRYNTISEFNGGTYAGVTLFAMSLAQYCPKNSTFYSTSPRLLSAIWDQIGPLEAGYQTGADDSSGDL